MQEAKGGDIMAQKDITEKTLESYNDVFADILNVLLFHGEQLFTLSRCAKTETITPAMMKWNI